MMLRVRTFCFVSVAFQPRLVFLPVGDFFILQNFHHLWMNKFKARTGDSTKSFRSLFSSQKLALPKFGPSKYSRLYRYFLLSSFCGVHRVHAPRLLPWSWVPHQKSCTEGKWALRTSLGSNLKSHLTIPRPQPELIRLVTKRRRARKRLLLCFQSSFKFFLEAFWCAACNFLSCSVKYPSHCD